MIKYYSKELGLTAIIEAVDHKTETVVYSTSDGSQHAEAWGLFLKKFASIIKN